MSIVRSKICGITRVEDALQAAEAGADAIGLVFYAKSPRAVSLEQARQILDALPPFVTTVGLFVNERPEVLRHLLEVLPLDVLQFHGDEPQEACMGYGRPWFKALRVRPEEPLSAQVAAYDRAQAILLDAFVAGVPGGTGQSFDWSLIPEDLKKPLILAGGLTVDNVQQAIEQVRPWAVDVSGGVEQAKGIKDGQKVQTFIQRVRAMM